MVSVSSGVITFGSDAVGAVDGKLPSVEGSAQATHPASTLAAMPKSIDFIRVMRCVSPLYRMISGFVIRNRQSKMRSNLWHVRVFVPA